MSSQNNQLSESSSSNKETTPTTTRPETPSTFSPPLTPNLTTPVNTTSVLPYDTGNESIKIAVTDLSHTWQTAVEFLRPFMPLKNVVWKSSKVSTTGMSELTMESLDLSFM